MSLQRLTCQNIADIEHLVTCDTELGRVRGIILIKEGYDVDTFIAKLNLGTAQGNYDAINLFVNAINSGDAHIISEANGSFDGGSAQVGDGYGYDEVERLLYYLYTLEFKDPSYAVNVDFWKNAEKANWRICWRTEKLLHFSDKAASIQAIAPVDEDLTSAVVWNIIAKWKSVEKPQVAPFEAIDRYFSGSWKHADPWTVDSDGYLLTDDIVVDGYLESSGIVSNNYLQKE